MTVIPFRPTTHLEIDRAGICCMLNGEAPNVGLVTLGRPYWAGDANPWCRMANERFERDRLTLRREPLVRDRHPYPTPEGGLVIHDGLVRRRARGGWVLVCRHLPLGDAALRLALGRHASSLILGLGESALACLVDYHGRAWWWPRAMAKATGCPSQQVLGCAPPVWRLTGEALRPFPDARVPYIGIAVDVGARGAALAANLTAAPVADVAQVWLFERRVTLVSMPSRLAMPRLHRKERRMAAHD